MQTGFTQGKITITGKDLSTGMDQLEKSETLYLHEEDEFDEEGDGGAQMMSGISAL